MSSENPPWVKEICMAGWLCQVCDSFTVKPEEHFHGINVEAWRELRRQESQSS
jgi:hypothetical protein